MYFVERLIVDFLMQGILIQLLCVLHVHYFFVDGVVMMDGSAKLMMECFKKNLVNEKII